MRLRSLIRLFAETILWVQRQRKRLNEFRILDDKEFDLFFAGPAFRAGRYGAACGHICSAVQKKFGVPAITSMNEENPGVEMYQKEMYIFKGGASAAAMRKDVAK